MTFTTSVGPDITESIPAPLSERTVALATLSSKIKFDLDINDVRFCLKPANDTPYVRQSTPVQKQQQDTSKEPGEQSLEGYWIRSQNSWHRGAGISFYEPGAEPDTEYRFAESSGVDVWTKGQVTPLKKMKLSQAATGNCYIQDAGDGHFAITSDTAILGWLGGSISTGTAPGHNGRWYFFGTDKRVKVGQSATADPTIGVWNDKTSKVIANNATLMPKVWFLKDRLITAHGVNIFEVPLNTASPVDLSLASSAAYAPADSGITWLDATEGPSAIYLAFTDGARDGIVRFTLQDASSGGSTPKLSQAYRVLELPAGERLYKIFGYLGRFLILSTSAGIRVCAVDGNADLTMGQVTVPASTTGRLNSFHADSSFVYVGGADVPTAGTSGGSTLPGWLTSSGFVRINLGEPIGDANDLRFAYAMDTRTSVNGTVTSSAKINATQQALAVNNSGVWVTDTAYEKTGYLAMGRVRYSTFVPKIFRSIDMAGTMPGGTGIQVQLLNEDEGPAYAISMDSTTGLFDTVGLDLTKLYRYVRPLLVLTSGTSGPTVTQVQLRSLPAPRRLRQIQYPLKCEDTEEDSRGVSHGRVGLAWLRIAALEEMEDAGLPVSVVDRRNGESFSAIIDEIKYVGTTAVDRNSKNFGGTVFLTLTKLS